MSRPELTGLLWAHRDSWPRKRLRIAYPNTTTIVEMGDVYSLSLDDDGRMLHAYRAALGEVGGVRYFTAPEGYVWAIRPFADVYHIAAMPEIPSVPPDYATATPKGT